MTSTADPFAEFAVAEPAPPAAQEADPFAEFAVTDSPVAATPAPAPQQRTMDWSGSRPPVEFEVTPAPEFVGPEDDQQALADTYIADVFHRAMRGDPNHDLESADISEATGVDPSLIKTRLDDFRANAKLAQENPRRWREQNPDLFETMLLMPHMGATVMKDQTVFKQVPKPDYDKWASEHPWERELGAMASGDPEGNHTIKTKQATEMQDLSHLNPVYVAGEAFMRSVADNTEGKREYFRMQAEFKDYDSDTSRAMREARIDRRINRGLDPYFGEGLANRTAATIASAVGAGADSMGALTLGSIIGIATRRPQLGMGVAKVAGAATSFVTETGSYWGETDDARDDKGNPIDRNIRFATANLYGALASGLEVLTLGAQGAGISALSAKRWAKSMMTDGTKRGALLEFAKTLGKDGFSEAGEGGAQQALSLSIQWLAKYASAGEIQKFDLVAAEGEVATSAVQEGLGGIFGIGGFTGLTNTTSALMNMRDSARSGARLAAIQEVAKTKAAQAAPRQVAAWISAQGQEDGRKVTHVYVDPTKIVEFASKGTVDVNDVATQLMGDEGPRRLQDALEKHGDADGARTTLEVPLAEYLEKWGGKPIAEALAEDISAGVGLSTMREQRLFQKSVQARADEIAAAEDIDVAAPGAGAIEEQLVAAGRPKREARLGAAFSYAMAESLAQYSGRKVEDVLAEMPSVTGVGIEQKQAAPAAGVETLNQPALESLAPELRPAAADQLRQDYQSLAPEEQRQRYFRDRNTGLRNFRALESAWQDQSRPHLALFSLEGAKFFNDEHGHGSVDGALRAMANAVRNIEPEHGAKVGSDIGVMVRDEAQAQEIADAMRKALPSEAQVTYDVGARRDTLKATIDAVAESHKAKRDAAVAAGTLADRGKAPVGLAQGDAGTVAELLTGVPHGTTATPLTAEHESAFTGDATTFETAHLDPSGLLSDDGFAQARANPKTRKAFAVSADLRGFAGMNGAFGREATDAIKAFFNQQLFKLGGGRFDTANLHGDEYGAQGNDEKQLRDWFGVTQDVLRRVVLWDENADGSFSLQPGLHFAYGVDPSEDIADRVELPKYKRRQDDRGRTEPAQRVGSRADLRRRIRDYARANGFESVVERRVRDLVSEHVQGRTAQAQSGAGPRDVRAAADQVADAAVAERLEQPAWHGTPHRGIEKFSTEKIGTGEGAQVYGWGLYFASNRGVADWYRKNLSGPSATWKGAPLVFRGARPHEGPLAVAIDRVAKVLKSTKDPADAGEVIAEARRQIEEEIESGEPHDGVLDALSRIAESGELKVSIAGQLHKVEVPNDDELLDYDKDIAQQPPGVLARLKTVWPFDKYPNLLDQYTGSGLYRFLAHDLGSDQAASMALQKAGIPGMRYLDGNSRASGEGSHNFVIWNDESIKTLETLYQDDKSPRGWIDIIRNGAKRQLKIFLTKNADASTFLHESTHAYFEMLGDIAEAPGASEEAVRDWATARKWAGAKEGEALTTEHKEKLARGFEAFVIEGKTPSGAMAEAFASFRRWLVGIYKTVAALGVELNDDIRGVFDRMLATDQEVDRARTTAGLNQPVFSTPEEAGVAPKDFDAYLAAQERVRSDVVARTQRMIHEGELRAAEAFKGEEFLRLRDQFEEEWASMPQAKAWRYVKNGEIVLPDGEVDTDATRGKLDRGAVIDLLGKDHPLIKRLIGRLAKSGGENPIDVAERFGFADTKDMLQKLADLPSRDAFAKAEAARAMRDLHPAIDGEIADLQAAIQKLLHEDSYDQAERDWQLIKARTKDPITIEALKRSAKEKVANQGAGRLDPGVVLNRERILATHMAQAIAEGNFERAMAFAHRRLLHKYMWQELTAAKAMRDKFIDLVGDLLAEKSQKRLGLVSLEHRDVIDSLLEAVGATPERDTEMPRKNLSDLISRMESDGDSVAFDRAFIGELLDKPRGWKSLKVSELRQVLETLQNIKASARNGETLLMNGRRVARDEFAGEFLAAGADIDGTRAQLSTKDAGTIAENVSMSVDRFKLTNLRPETMLERFGEPGRAIVKMLQDAKHKKSDILAKTVKPISDVFDNIPKSVRNRFQESIDGGALFPDYHDKALVPRRRYELITIALNSGAVENINNLRDGNGITDAQRHDALSLLTKEELNFVQTVWDAADSMWPLVRDLEERYSGVAPPRVVRVPMTITTSDGHTVNLRGGYFPIVHDNRGDTGFGQRAEIRNAAEVLDVSLGRPGTSRSHTNRRTGAIEAVSLEPSTFQLHISRVANDLAFREPLRAAVNILLREDVKAMMRTKLGKDAPSVFESWLRNIGQSVAAQAALSDSWLWSARAKIPRAVLGFNIANLLGDFTGIVTPLIGTSVSKRHWVAAMTRYWLGLRKRSTREFALSKSGELRSRWSGDEAYQGFQNRARSLTQSRHQRIVSAIAEHAFFFHEQLEKAVITPLWDARYRQALDEGSSDEDAVSIADTLVRQEFPAKSVVDKASIQTDKGVLGFMAMFSSFPVWVFNKYYRFWEPVGRAVGAKAKAFAATRALLAHIAFATVVGPLGELLVGRGPPPGGDDDEWERWGEWYVRKMVTAHLMPIPLVGGFIESAIDGRSSTRFPALVAADSAWKAAQKIYAVATDDDNVDPEDAVLAAMRAYGFLSSAPTNAIARSLEYLIEDDFSNEGGILSGIIYGERRDKDGNSVQPDNLIKMADRAMH